jgi:hypothetical protein
MVLLYTKGGRQHTHTRTHLITRYDSRIVDGKSAGGGHLEPRMLRFRTGGAATR